ncbi:MAG: LysM peptidoglycan-binding domain-containing protein [Zetaproteobacteria bacterium]|nr:LysM peptidoglycan-binding domain-containing protein [Zetaproteobacteria bacterium]
MSRTLAFSVCLITFLASCSEKHLLTLNELKAKPSNPATDTIENGSDEPTVSIAMNEERGTEADRTASIIEQAAIPTTDDEGELIADLDLAEREEVREISRRLYDDKYWPTIAARSTYVLARITPIIAELHAPLDLLAVPVIESAYSPYAFSYAGASGLWQIMPGTATHLGIEKRKESDGRRHVEESTRAAITYLTTLNNRFQSWPLAIAAYHLGPNAVERRLKQSPWDISQGIEKMPVPLVTKNYVRMVIGLSSLLHMQERTFPTPIETTTITIKAPIDLIALERALKMEPNALFLFNPSLNHSVYVKQQPIELVVPIALKEKAITLANNLKPMATTKKIAIQAGDTLWGIARQHQTTPSQLKSLNPSLGKILTIGHPIIVPLTGSMSTSAKNIHSDNPLIAPSRRIHYEVRSGDSLWKIAQRFGTTTVAIAKTNRIKTSSTLRPGDRLWIVKHPG